MKDQLIIGGHQMARHELVTIDRPGRCPVCDVAVPAGWVCCRVPSGEVVCSATCVSRTDWAIDKEYSDIPDLEEEIDEIEDEIAEMGGFDQDDYDVARLVRKANDLRVKLKHRVTQRDQAYGPWRVNPNAKTPHS